jgi:hypothetical protein
MDGAVIHTHTHTHTHTQGLVVWIVQLVELGMFYYFPERYEEIMAHELEEVQRLYLLTSTKVQIPTGKCVCEAGVETENFLLHRFESAR